MKRKIIAIVSMLCLLCFILMGCSDDKVELEMFDTEVTIENGVVIPETDSREIVISKDGTYQFHWVCKPDHGGLITGCRVYDAQNEIVIQCTAEEMTMDSEELDLAEGTYTLQVYYLNNAKDWETFVEEGGEVFDPTDADGNSDMDYEFAESGTWKIHMEYGMETGSLLEYVLGLIFGMVIGIVLVTILLWGIRKLGGRFETSWQLKKDSYDERQIISRGKAYKVAFYTLVVYIMVIALLQDLMDISLFMSFGGIWLGVCIAFFLFATVCIWQDAYMSLYENPKGVILMFLILGVINIIGGVSLMKSGTILDNGALSANCVNLETGILSLLVMFVFAARVAYNNKHMDEEDEE